MIKASRGYWDVDRCSWVVVEPVREHAREVGGVPEPRASTAEEPATPGDPR